MKTETVFCFFSNPLSALRAVMILRQPHNIWELVGLTKCSNLKDVAPRGIGLLEL